MLSPLLLAGLLAAPIATVALFVPTSRRPRRDDKPSTPLARFVLALLCSAILIAAVGVILSLIGVTTGHIEAAVIGLALATLV
jgi:small neutral amino acid transporter SnatA (MarC family)